MVVLQREQRRIARLQPGAEPVPSQPGVDRHVDGRGRTVCGRDGRTGGRQWLFAGGPPVNKGADRSGAEPESMKKAFACVLFLLAVSANAGTTDNDDSCDISVLPAATLFLPYFEVDFHPPSRPARTTLFTIQNATAMPQIARARLW